MKLRRHVAGKKVEGEGRNDGGRMERRRAGRRGVYIPRRALPAASPARLFCASLEVSHVYSRPKAQLPPH